VLGFRCCKFAQDLKSKGIRLYTLQTLAREKTILTRFKVTKGENKQININVEKEVTAHYGPGTCLAISSNGKFIASGTGGGEVAIFNCDCKLLYKKEVHALFVTSLHFSPDSKYLVSGSGDGSLKITTFKESSSKFSVFLLLLSILVLLYALLQPRIL